MKTLRLSEIKVKRRFRKDMGDLQRLKDSIEDVGLIQPIVVNSKNELIAGARRLAAMRELGMKNIPVVVADIDPLSGEIHENTLRKDFTISELVAIRRAVAKTRKPGTRTDLGANYAEVEKGRSSEIVEKLTGISARNLDKMESIVSAVEEKPSSWVRVVGINGSKPVTRSQLLQMADSGKLSVDMVYSMIKEATGVGSPVERKPTSELVVLALQNLIRDRLKDFIKSYSLKNLEERERAKATKLLDEIIGILTGLMHDVDPNKEAWG